MKRIAGIIGLEGGPMSGKQKAATPTGEPVAKRGRGGGGRGAGRKAGGVNARGVDDPALPAKRQSSLADLLGPRFAPKKVESPLVEPLAAVAGPSLAASSPVNEAGPSSAARAVAAEPFQSSQELGEQWHHLCGFGEMELVEQHYYNVLILVSIVMCIAVDTSICERGFSTMNNLKTARRSNMSTMLLRTLMVICELGQEWREDPSQIPVEEIVEEWRSQSSKGRYESAMWRRGGAYRA